MALSYRDAGVDLEAAERFTRSVGVLSATTTTTHVLPSRGGFASLVGLPGGYTDPVIVASTDGVGTKLALALAAGRPALVGHDLVAMCLNDIVTTGAVPLFFLDYLATDKIEGSVLLTIVEGIVEACRASGCALTGGETAEMPGLLATGGVEIAGFAVGIVERHRVLSASLVAAGDVLVGVRTTGLHANGFSLVRRVLADGGLGLDDTPGELGMSLADALLRRTPLYVHVARALADTEGVHALAHVTGGGLVRNVQRLLPRGLVARVSPRELLEAETSGVIGFLARRGPITSEELRRTFPVGVGFVAAVAEARVTDAEAAIASAGETSVRLGRVEPEASALAPRVVFE